MSAAKEPVVTHGGASYAWRLCRCSECGVERHCTPDFDFYVREGQPEDGPLVCEPCLVRGVSSKPVVNLNQNLNLN